MRTFRVPRDLPEKGARVNTLVTFRVSRIEPHENPNWLEPPEGFMGASPSILGLVNDMGQSITDPFGGLIYVTQQLPLVNDAAGIVTDPFGAPIYVVQ